MKRRYLSLNVGDKVRITDNYMKRWVFTDENYDAFTTPSGRTKKDDADYDLYITAFLELAIFKDSFATIDAKNWDGTEYQNYRILFASGAWENIAPEDVRRFRK